MVDHWTPILTMTIPSTLRVLFLASEADPLVKVGGLGDVAGSLPKALHNLSGRRVDIRLVIPFHGSIRLKKEDLHLAAELVLPHRDGQILTKVYETTTNGLRVYLISGPPIPMESPVYSNDQQKDAFKYIYFSLAALQLTEKIGFCPHILHANDWHTSAAVYAMATHHSSASYLKSTASILQVHNLPYLGETTSPVLEGFGLPPSDHFRLPVWAQNMILPLGLLTADHIVTVSPTYAKEILTSEFGSGLQDFLRARANSISGILNGIDTEYWNPMNDQHIAAKFSCEIIQNRVENKRSLQEEINFRTNVEIPLIAMISRLDYQKGVDLAISALRILSDKPWQAIILGTGSPELEKALSQLEREFQNKFHPIFRFDPALSRKIYAGADMLLMPSRYEPCGLAQMIAMRYGCVPIAHSTGGLKDTIRDDPTFQDGTGFLFHEPTGGALASTIQRALDVHKQPNIWQQLQSNGMRMDFSWERSARKYLRLYETLIASKDL